MNDPAAPVSLAAIVGSLRADSTNREVFEAARGLVPSGVVLEEVSLAEVPLFNQDLEGDHEPSAVVALKAGVDAADGLVVFTPEFNRSMPAVTKNAIDWLSRPFLAGPILGKPVGIVTAGPGRGDGPGCRDHLAATTAATGGSVFDPSLGLSSITRVMTDGVVTDDEVRDRLTAWLAAFAAFAAARDEDEEPDGA